MAAVTKNLENWQAKLDKILHEKNACTNMLQKVEEKTGVRRLYIVLGIASVLALYLMIGYGADFLCNLIGFLYPAYASVKAVESRMKDDDTKWLTYWVVYSFFSLLEFFTDIFLWWIPLYWFFKCGFLIYCMVPITKNGSVVIYNNIIKPFVLRNQKKIDKALDEAASVAKDAFDEAHSAAADAAADTVRQTLADSSKSD